MNQKNYFFPLLALLIMGLSVTSTAQTPQYAITAGNSTNYFPLSTTVSNKVQWVYTPASFPTAPAGTITDIYFRSGTTLPSGGTATFTNFEVKIGYTTLAAFTAGAFATGLTTVYTAPSQTFTGVTSMGWLKVTLQTPFYYTGTQNFIVELSQTAYTNGGITMYQNTSGGNLRLYGAPSSPTGAAATGLVDLGFDLQLCPNPTNLAANSIMMTSADFTWTPPSTSQGVEYALTTSPAAPAAGTPTTASFYNATGLTNGTNYWFHVRNKCSANLFSPWQTLPITTQFAPCFEPTGITVSHINMHGADISWGPSASANPQGYECVVSTGNTPPISGNTTTTTNYAATGLTEDTKYYVFVRTHCMSTNYSPWIMDSFNTSPVCVPADSITISNVTTNSAHIEWDKFPGVESYEYFIDNNPAPPAIAGTNTNYNAFAPTNLYSGTTYYFHLRTKCDTANITPWVTTSFTTQNVCATPPLPAVSNITGTTAKFDWSSIAGAIGYEYGVTTTNMPPDTNIFYSSFPTVTVKNLSINTNYYFHIRSFCNSHDLSGWETISFSTAPTSVSSLDNDLTADISVYPNPVNDVLNITINGVMKGTMKIILTDMAGKIMMVKEATGNQVTINMSQFAAGMYLVKFMDNENSGAMRIQKL